MNHIPHVQMEHTRDSRGPRTFKAEKEDMVVRVALLFFILWGSILVNPTFAMERHIMEPRVPPDKIEEARSLVSPLPDAPDIAEKGKAIYEGKGTCFNCHGKTGGGDGQGGGVSQSFSSEFSSSWDVAASDGR
jgi:hypothetical protein